MKLIGLVLTSLALASTLTAGNPVSFAGLDGEWSGYLEYSDYTSGKRVKIRTVAELDSSKDGKELIASIVFDDFGRILRDQSKYKIDLKNRKFIIRSDVYGLSDSQTELIATGFDTENGKRVPARMTFSRGEGEIVFLKETGTPLQFRNRFVLKRSGSYRLRILSPDQMKEDFRVLKRALLELHPGIHRYNTHEEFEGKLKRMESSLNAPMKEDKFFRLFAEILSEIKCYHTYPNPINQPDKIKNGLFDRRVYFPFYFQIVDRKMLVTESAASKTVGRGSEITRINGVPVSEVLDELLATTYADGKGTIEHRLQTLELTKSRGAGYSIFDMVFPLLFPPSNKTFKIEAIDFETGKKVKFEVLALTRKERSEEMRKRYGAHPTYDDGWKFEILDKETAYLRMDHFLTWRLSFKVEEFLADSFKRVREKAIKNLIVDIRGSTGGYDGVYRELFKYLSADPISCRSSTKQFFKTARADRDLLVHASSWDPSFKANLLKGYPSSIYTKAKNGLLELNITTSACDPIAPYENNFRGNAYLLVSSNNASAAFTLAYYVKKWKLATLIGQETGGNLRGFNGSQYLSFELPNSGFQFDLPLLAEVIDENAEDSGVMPDVLVVQKRDDIGNAFDRELAKAKEQIARDRVRD